MLEIYVRSADGWQPLTCGCAASRAAFSSQAAADEAVVQHLRSCIGADPRAHSISFRTFPAEAA